MDYICPHLGLIDDPNTNRAFPNKAHACFRADTPTLIKIDYQRLRCLSPSHTNCPGYQYGWAKQFPKDLTRKRSGNKSLGKALKWIIIFILGGIAIYSLISFVPKIFAQQPKAISTLAGGYQPCHLHSDPDQGANLYTNAHKQ